MRFLAQLVVHVLCATCVSGAWSSRERLSPAEPLHLAWQNESSDERSMRNRGQGDLLEAVRTPATRSQPTLEAGFDGSGGSVASALAHPRPNATTSATGISGGSGSSASVFSFSEPIMEVSRGLTSRMLRMLGTVYGYQETTKAYAFILTSGYVIVSMLLYTLVWLFECSTCMPCSQEQPRKSAPAHGGRQQCLRDALSPAFRKVEKLDGGLKTSNTASTALPNVKFKEQAIPHQISLSSKCLRLTLTPTLIPLSLLWGIGMVLLGGHKCLEATIDFLRIPSCVRVISSVFFFVPGILLISPLYFGWAYCIWYRKLLIFSNADISVGEPPAASHPSSCFM